MAGNLFKEGLRNLGYLEEAEQVKKILEKIENGGYSDVPIPGPGTVVYETIYVGKEGLAVENKYNHAIKELKNDPFNRKALKEYTSLFWKINGTDIDVPECDIQLEKSGLKGLRISFDPGTEQVGLPDLLWKFNQTSNPILKSIATQELKSFADYKSPFGNAEIAKPQWFAFEANPKAPHTNTTQEDVLNILKNADKLWSTESGLEVKGLTARKAIIAGLTTKPVGGYFDTETTSRLPGTITNDGKMLVSAWYPDGKFVSYSVSEDFHTRTNGARFMMVKRKPV